MIGGANLQIISPTINVCSPDATPALTDVHIDRHIFGPQWHWDKQVLRESTCAPFTPLATFLTANSSPINLNHEVLASVSSFEWPFLFDPFKIQYKLLWNKALCPHVVCANKQFQNSQACINHLVYIYFDLLWGRSRNSHNDPCLSLKSFYISSMDKKFYSKIVSIKEAKLSHSCKCTERELSSTL